MSTREENEAALEASDMQHAEILRPYEMEGFVSHKVAEKTPLPWSAAKFDDEAGWCIIGREGDERIADVDGNQLDQAEANAAHIVLCVNSHDKLVDALKGLLAHDLEHESGWGSIVPAVKAARQALKDAEG